MFNHVNKAEDERDLHLVGVQEGDLVFGDLPDRIETHVVRIHLVHRTVARIQHRLLRGQRKFAGEVSSEYLKRKL